MSEERGTTARVLVLMAAFNGADWIRCQIESILAQRGVDVSIVISDDGSNDATRVEVERFASGGRVRLISPPCPTGSAAQNFFFLITETAADGFDLIAFADQDDCWKTDRLERANRALVSKGAGGYSSAVTAVWRSGRRRIMRQSHSCTDADFLFEGAGQGCTFVLSSTFYRRLRAFYIEHAELTRVLHYHDWATYALSRVWGVPWILDPIPTLEYRQHGENDTGARYSAAGMRKRLVRVATGWYREQIRAVTRLCLAAQPRNLVVATWASVFVAPRSWRRSLRVASFCLRNGRRRPGDNAILVLAALSGRI